MTSPRSWSQKHQVSKSIVRWLLSLRASRLGQVFQSNQKYQTPNCCELPLRTLKYRGHRLPLPTAVPYQILLMHSRDPCLRLASNQSKNYLPIIPQRVHFQLLTKHIKSHDLAPVFQPGARICIQRLRGMILRIIRPCKCLPFANNSASSSLFASKMIFDCMLIPSSHKDHCVNTCRDYLIHCILEQRFVNNRQ